MRTATTLWLERLSFPTGDVSPTAVRPVFYGFDRLAETRYNESLRLYVYLFVEAPRSPRIRGLLGRSQRGHHAEAYVSAQ